MRLVSIATVPILIAAGLTATPTATADCTSSAGTSVCSQGDVRGANTGQGPGSVPTYNPNYCWWCNNDGWGLTFVIVRPPRGGGGGGGGEGRRR
ncbi:hypothetical protein MPSYJ_37430 [Mycolicibacterium psychrotolerans]|uniref:Secreted protein n=1 Tax=Mycolicibacterium psychrotolerans TaxID=216929 RepID=A0A7I7MEJ9_9MYCO|nr:hypothetical protein MPSYJ_37430 [Mycolicibacterium psychrotolerans]